MRKLAGLLCFIILLWATTTPAQAQTPDGGETYYRARVLNILAEEDIEVAGFTNPYQKVSLLILSGPNAGQEIELEHGGVYTIGENQKVSPGETVVLSALVDPNGNLTFWITDRYRLTPILIISLAFVGLVLLISRLKGLGSVIGMLLSLVVIVRFIVPQILDGKDPLLISLLGGLFIMFTTMYLAHGYSRQTTIAISATFLTLAATGVLAYLFVAVSHLTGMGSEDAYSLQFGPTQIINLRGLLLGGIIIGALGVLDDVTTTQTAAVFELAEAQKKPRFKTLFTQGMRIGREHVNSLVNTLIMAYAGASLPLFIFFVFNPSGQPAWVIINHELIAEEIVRSLTGSFGLVLAVPLSTALSAWIAVKYGSMGTNSHAGHVHAHRQ